MEENIEKKIDENEGHEHCHDCSCAHHHGSHEAHSHSHESSAHQHTHESCGSGIKCSCCHDDDDDDEDKNALKKIILSAIVFVIALCVEHLPVFGENSALLSSLKIPHEFVRDAYIILYLVSYLLCGRNVVIGAVKNLRRGNVFGEQFLMSVASLGAVFVGEFGEAVAVMLFYMIGEYFQDYAVDRSKDSISALMDIRPDRATLLKNGEELSVSPEDVSVGELILVRPGERVPLDGIVEEGETFADTSALTGESLPRKISSGEEITSGFVNVQGVVKVRVTKSYGESAVTRILNLTQKAGEVKARSEKFITRFSKVYTPIVCALALAVAILPPLILWLSGNAELNSVLWNKWIYRALMFLVVSCPCALVISVPLTFFSGIGSASSRGILVKGSNFMENLAKVKVAVFDKTGTLTKGFFKVTQVSSINKERFSDDELLSLAAHAEFYSNHPISRSLKESHVAKIGSDECCRLARKENYEELGGHGVKVLVDGRRVLAGNAKLMKNEGVRGFVDSADSKRVFGTVVHIACDGEYAGFIVISDEVKENAEAALKGLKSLGIKKTVMLTGDNEDSAKHIASLTGVDEYYSQLLPEDKVSRVEEIIASSSGEKVLFAGDGVNDSPVLARADVGVAMGALGSDAAIEAADVVIVDDNLDRLCDGIKIARKTVSIVNENIVISLGIKIAIMVLGALGITNMWFAVFGDVGVMFLAVLNSMRALRR